MENPSQPTDESTEQAASGDAVEQAMADAQNNVDQLQDELADAAGGEDQLIETGRLDFAEGIDLLGDVDLDVTIELGRTEMLVEDVLRLQGGSVVELDKLAGDPVDVYVNGRMVARGEVLVLNDNFCIRVSEILANLEEQAEAAAQEQAEESVEQTG